ncbi:energy-coupling factor ABC transporter substrate-binding protein [Thermanaerosceptrum fracticalcis]|uniref:Cobalt transport protein CbiN n=1 Tax=Thermanaerosceptrum fracticalcis TaxID=1712410 RepID=A0A7G6E2Y7_THEFR|nr:energy-coupling factor ABC transporter substrate-binding protein [Thermanaerosceptrum fracticalcis]QNB46441.1 energy-coupling factor ABC transporter substrate-binding protein [Thermanaerosceptrum fracticalcis]
MTLARKNLLLIFAVVVLTIMPLIMITDSEFGGADGAAEEVILQIKPDYEPWFPVLWQPPGGETESLLFALQAAIGGAFLGYYFGIKKGLAGK